MLTLTALARKKGSSLTVLSGGEENYFIKAFYIIFYKMGEMYTLICRWGINQFSNYFVHVPKCSEISMSKCLKLSSFMLPVFLNLFCL